MVGCEKVNFSMSCTVHELLTALTICSSFFLDPWMNVDVGVLS